MLISAPEGSALSGWRVYPSDRNHYFGGSRWYELSLGGCESPIPLQRLENSRELMGEMGSTIAAGQSCHIGALVR